MRDSGAGAARSLAAVLLCATLGAAGGCDGDSDNRPPVAAAGPDRSVEVGVEVRLDGTASTDPDGDPLVFTWALTARPAGSVAAITDPYAATPTFRADVSGAYTAELTVTDVDRTSAPDTVVVTASEPRNGGVLIVNGPAVTESVVAGVPTEFTFEMTRYGTYTVTLTPTGGDADLFVCAYEHCRPSSSLLGSSTHPGTEAEMLAIEAATAGTAHLGVVSTTGASFDVHVVGSGAGGHLDVNAAPVADSVGAGATTLYSLFALDRADFQARLVATSGSPALLVCTIERCSAAAADLGTDPGTGVVDFEGVAGGEVHFGVRSADAATYTIRYTGPALGEGSGRCTPTAPAGSGTVGDPWRLGAPLPACHANASAPAGSVFYSVPLTPGSWRVDLFDQAAGTNRGLRLVLAGVTACSADQPGNANEHCFVTPVADVTMGIEVTDSAGAAGGYALEVW